MTTFASVTLPYFENASLRLSSVVDQDRFPTKHRYSSSSAITARRGRRKTEARAAWGARAAQAAGQALGY